MRYQASEERLLDDIFSSALLLEHPEGNPVSLSLVCVAQVLKVFDSVEFCDQRAISPGSVLTDLRFTCRRRVQALSHLSALDLASPE